MSDPALEFRPRPLSRRTWLRLGVIALVVAVLYALVAFFYNAEGGYTLSGSGAEPGSGIELTIDPVTVNAQSNLAEMQFSFSPSGSELFDADGHLTQNLRVVVDAGAGSKEIRFPAGSVPSAQSFTVPLIGELAQYPFDTHTGSAYLTVDTFTKAADGTLTSDQVYIPSIDVVGGVNGWDTAVEVDDTAASTGVDFSFSRAFSTQVFALMLLGLAVMLAAATVIVAFLVASQRRRAEIGLMSWTAALLFALPALRTFMPNSPPIGAAIDMYVYLWVMAGAIGAAIIMIVSWVRQSGRSLLEDPTAGSGGVPKIPDTPYVDVTGD
jgi:hypothetical protein